VRPGGRFGPDIEFQSSPHNSDLFRFMFYHVLFAEKFSIEERVRVPVSSQSLCSAGIERCPQNARTFVSRPGKSGFLFTPDRILPEDLVDMSEVVRKYWDRIENWNPEREGFPLTEVECAELYYAPL
jgi:hypothetical protein